MFSEKHLILEDTLFNKVAKILGKSKDDSDRPGVQSRSRG